MKLHIEGSLTIPPTGLTKIRAGAGSGGGGGLFVLMRSAANAQAHAENPAASRKICPRRTNIRTETRNIPLFSLKCLYPGSGRKIPAIRYGAGADHDGFYPMVETEY